MKKKIISNEERSPLCISEIDKLIMGGLEKGSVNFIAGAAGSGKSIFAAQFLVNGAKRCNEPGVYISFEEGKNSFYKHMNKFNWDLDGLEKQGLFYFIEYTPEQVKKMLDEGGGTIESLINKKKISRLVIDSITSFGLLFKDELARKEAIIRLFELLRSWGITSIVIGEELESKIEQQEAGEFEFEADAVFLLYFLKERDIRKRAIEILKMRGTDQPKKIMLMKIDNKGINIFPDQPVF